MYRISLLILLTLCLRVSPLFAGEKNPDFTSDPRRRGIAGYGTNLWAVASLHLDTAVAFGDGGTVRLSTDSGAVWSITQNIDGGLRVLTGGAMIDSVTLCTVGEQGIILMSTDLGITWSHQSVDTLLTLFGVAFYDRNDGIVIGDSGAIFRTTDGGGTWQRRSAGTTRPLLGISLAGDSAGTIVGGAGFMTRTLDRGGSWTTLASGVTNYLYGVSFPDPLTGTAVGTVGTILRTTDGGVHWQKQKNPDSLDYFFAVSFSDTLNGMAVGTNGHIIRTSNGGASWTDIPPRTVNSFYSVLYRDSTDWIAVGGWGTIAVGSDTGAIVTSVPRQGGGYPLRPYLAQNYPNPFNPSTRIEYYLPARSHVTLTIYDMLGRIVTRLVDGSSVSGWHTAVWSPENCATGVYFYRLEIEGTERTAAESITRKLLLIR